MNHNFHPDFWRPLSLRQLHHMKNWNAAHQLAHPLEDRTWNFILTVWMMGWMGWLPCWVFGASWAYPCCVAAMLLPQSYVYLRAQAHLAGMLRCDWLNALT